MTVFCPVARQTPGSSFGSRMFCSLVLSRRRAFSPLPAPSLILCLALFFFTKPLFRVVFLYQFLAFERASSGVAPASLNGMGDRRTITRRKTLRGAVAMLNAIGFIGRF